MTVISYSYTWWYSWPWDNSLLFHGHSMVIFPKLRFPRPSRQLRPPPRLPPRCPRSRPWRRAAELPWRQRHGRGCRGAAAAAEGPGRGWEGLSWSGNVGNVRASRAALTRKSCGMKCWKWTCLMTSVADVFLDCNRHISPEVKQGLNH